VHSHYGRFKHAPEYGNGHFKLLDVPYLSTQVSELRLKPISTLKEIYFELMPKYYGDVNTKELNGDLLNALSHPVLIFISPS
jgi:hypothetical protein